MFSIRNGVKSNCYSVLVLGSHRVGTSVLSRALETAGVYLGEGLIGPRSDNPKGFFEDQIANQLDEDFLNEIQCRWDSLVLPVAIEPQAITAYQEQLKDKILKRFKDKPIWGLKDPRISRLWSYWLPVFAEAGIEPVFVLANRHPFSVANSLAKRDRMPEAHALALWAVHQLDALEALLQQGGLVVDYDLLMDRPRQEVQRIASFLGVETLLDSDEVAKFESEFLADDLRHSRYPAQTAASVASPLQMLCLELHAGLLELSQLPGGLDAEHLDHARNLVTKCRNELAKSIDWMHAIDALQAIRFSDFTGKVTSEALLECEARIYLSEVVKGVPQSYTESRGAATLYPISKQHQTVCLPLPADLKTLARIRLDPSNRPVGVLLHSLALMQPDGTEAWRWDGGCDVFVNPGGVVCLPGEAGATLLCLNNDPQFDLAIPPAVLALVRGGAVLSLELTAKPLPDELPAVLTRLQAKAKLLPATTATQLPVTGLAGYLEDLADQLKTQITRKNATIAAQHAELEAMRARQQLLYEQVVRAEAQLDLLKEFALPEAGSRLERL